MNWSQFSEAWSQAGVWLFISHLLTHTHPRNTHSCRHASLRGVRVTWDVSEDGRLLSGLFIGWICCHSFRLFSSQFQGKAATVEPWEDTNFHLYKVVDRFGFVQ